MFKDVVSCAGDATMLYVNRRGAGSRRGLVKIKVITLYQPWASLVAIGVKRIETRSWATSFRGPLAIHAAKTFPKSARDLCGDDQFTFELVKGGYMRPDELPRGAVIATCRLVGCKMIISMPTVAFNRPDVRYYTEGMSEQEKAFGDYTPGRYVWILEDVKILPEPIPEKGHQRLWNWEPPGG